MNLKQPVLLLLATFILTAAAFTQQPKQDAASREQLIAASQAGSSPLFFNAAATDLPVLQPLAFDNTKECTVRNGLPNFFNKVRLGKQVTIAYVGGSITQAVHGYRTRSAHYIQSLFPSVPIKAINAGVSGTGTDLGACRLYEQVIQYHPDLVFIEFAVNGAYKEGMEGMIRQLARMPPGRCLTMYKGLKRSQTIIRSHLSIWHYSLHCSNSRVNLYGKAIVKQKPVK